MKQREVTWSDAWKEVSPASCLHFLSMHCNEARRQPQLENYERVLQWRHCLSIWAFGVNLGSFSSIGSKWLTTEKFSQYGIIVDMTFPFRASISKFQACANWASKLGCEANTSFNKADTCMKRRVWPEGKIKARWAQSKECCHCINWAVVDGNMQSVSRQE